MKKKAESLKLFTEVTSHSKEIWKRRQSSFVLIITEITNALWLLHEISGGQTKGYGYLGEYPEYLTTSIIQQHCFQFRHQFKKMKCDCIQQFIFWVVLRKANSLTFEKIKNILTYTFHCTQKPEIWVNWYQLLHIKTLIIFNLNITYSITSDPIFYFNRTLVFTSWKNHSKILSKVWVERCILN